MPEVVTKKLVCPVCGDILAEARYRRWPGRLNLTGVTGYSIMPIAAGVMRRISERELDDAVDDQARERARDRIEAIDRSSVELIYDLTCPRGHATLRTAPQITRAITQTRGEWVDLAR